MSAIRRGALIVLEGLDRSGKSTQAQRLATYLTSHAHKAELFRFPNRTSTTGRVIDAYLQQSSDLDDNAVHLLFSANRWEQAQKIKQAIEQGVIVIVDRYSYSGVAFTAAKGLDAEWCRAPEIGLPRPDLVIFLEVSDDVAAARTGFGGERYEKSAFQERVRKEFGKLAQHPSTRDHWTTIDANRDMDSVHDSIVKLALDAIDKSATEALQSFV